jgi:hypothetical protein
VASLSLSACAVGRNHASDATLERFFNEHQTEFEALLAEVQADSELKTLQPRVVIYAGRAVEVQDGDLSEIERLGLARERWQHYQKKLRDLGLSGVMKGDGDIEFIVDSGSLLNGDSYKGYRYTSNATCHIRASLDSYRRSDHDKDKVGNWDVCKPLKRSWYLYLFVNR